MSNSRAHTAIRDAEARRRGSSTLRGRALSGEPAGRGGATPGIAVRVTLGPSEWALAVPPPGTAHLQPPPQSLTGPFLPPLRRQFTLVRVPALGDPHLGLAVLHYRRGHARLYCPADRITDRAGRALSSLIGQTVNDIAGAASCLAIAPVDHSLLLAGLHPAAPIPCGSDITIAVCSNLIDAELAEVLGALCTAHAAHLIQLGHSGTEAGVPQPRPASAGVTGGDDQPQPSARPAARPAGERWAPPQSA